MIRTLLFSTLYPNSVRSSHGIFVETRLRHLIASGEVETCVVAQVPWFPLLHTAFGEYAKQLSWAPTTDRQLKIFRQAGCKPDYSRWLQ
jgi:teichuronic acid biosynthesis glycosyltransferase TuaC